MTARAHSGRGPALAVVGTDSQLREESRKPAVAVGTPVEARRDRVGAGHRRVVEHDLSENGEAALLLSEHTLLVNDSLRSESSHMSCDFCGTFSFCSHMEKAARWSGWEQRAEES